MNALTATKSAAVVGAAANVAFFGKRQFGNHHASDMPLPRRTRPGLAVTLAVLDLVFMYASAAAFVLAIRGRLDFSTITEAGSAVTCIALVSVTLAYATGCYRHDAFTDFSTATTRLAVGLGVSVVTLVPLMHFGLGLVFDSLAFLSISRSLTIVLIGVGVELCGGMLSRFIFMVMINRQLLRRTILIIGTGTRARHLRDVLAQGNLQLIQVYFLSEAYVGGTPPTGLPGKEVDALVGTPTAGELASKLQVDQVVVAVDDPNGVYLDDLLPWKANGIPVVDFNTFLERETGRVDITWTAPEWLLYSDGFRFGLLDRVLKRLLDVGVSIAFLFMTLPVLLIVSAAIMLDDFGPVFYWQERVSRRGRPFWIVKFRTMRVDAEQNGAQWASENDSRVTRVGRLLRRTRIDEIPQLFNVLKGEMSLVGPRPERPVFVDDLSERIHLYHLRHSVRAGLTGWAQINYHYGASVDEAVRKLEYDLYYLKHFTVLRDIAIMLQTLRILLFAKGGR